MDMDSSVPCPLKGLFAPVPECLYGSYFLGILDTVSVQVCHGDAIVMEGFRAVPIVHVENVVNVCIKKGLQLIVGRIPHDGFDRAKCFPRRFPQQESFFGKKISSRLELFQHIA
jgi:hypothetical protein